MNRYATFRRVAIISLSLVLALGFAGAAGASEAASGEWLLTLNVGALLFWLAAIRHHLLHGRTGWRTLALFVTGVFGALIYWLTVDVDSTVDRDA